MRRGVAVPGSLGQLPARPALRRPSQQRPDIRKRRQPRPGLLKHRSKQRPQLILKPAQPAAIFYDGHSGHLLILSSHKA
jgi:hypothetical protein